MTSAADVLAKCAHSNSAEQVLAASEIVSAQAALASDEVDQASGQAAAAMPMCADLEAKWKEFQAKFDNLFALGAKRLSGMVGDAVGVGRPPERINEFRLAQILRRSSRVVVLTGAGISAESGIPTFRGSDGYWTVGSKNYKPQELATWAKFDEMPQELWHWYLHRWGVCRAAKPNPGHFALVELQSLLEGGLDLVTQNIDGLHLDAGSDRSRLYEVHGRIDEMRCDERIEGACLHGLSLDDPANFSAARATIVQTPPRGAENEKVSVPHCALCGVRQRPKILWFDECYNEAIFRSKTAMEAVTACDVLLIIGTQLTTGLPSQMVSESRAQGKCIVRIDPFIEIVDEGLLGMLLLQGASGQLLPRVVAELRTLMAEPLLAPLAPVAPSPEGETQTTSEESPAATSGAGESSVAVTGTGRRSTRSSPSPARRGTSPRTAAAAKATAKATATARGSTRSPARQPRSPARVSSSSNGETFKSTANRRTPSPAASDDIGPVMGFFVYGTLRPDDDSGAPWTQSFCEGLNAEAALLFGASLYVESYPSLCLEQTRCSVRGTLLTPPMDATGRRPDPDVMRAKLAEADRIEGYPGLYDRAVVSVEVLDSHQAETAESDTATCATVAAPGKAARSRRRRAYVYHRTNRFDRSQVHCIADGDWLSRPRS
eukprot:TRINITY_DN45574_c0_g1_i1.p1 TRINITY_DN45574_c0_g1~~TRINITY_DN45574_c0_g1_i1.p1  ORF type:complete len:661 (-),score=107.08 TRINITY_DN45574_c0_g1_i1:71-2053(-)